MNEFTSQICGIPCVVKVRKFRCVPGSGGYDATSDLDFSGYSEIEYDILDRRGKSAAWLTDKLTEMDATRIDAEVAAYMEAIL